MPRRTAPPSVARRGARAVMTAALVLLATASCGSPAPGWWCDARAGLDTCTLRLAAADAEPAPWRCLDVAGGRLCTAPRGTASRLPARYRCRDTRDLRVCVDPSPPRPDARTGTWRCTQRDGRRTCKRRGSGHGPWLREPGSGPAIWAQRRYSVPDEAEWECAEIRGIAYCRSTGEPAAVSKRAPAPFWICGADPAGRRVCVDPDPDRPPDMNARLACHFDHQPPRRRWCETRTTDDGACHGDGDCGAGAVCVGARCAPLVSEVRCYFDTDCGAGSGMKCRWGACVGADAEGAR